MPSPVEDRVEEDVLVGDARGRDRLALEVGDVLDAGVAERDQRGERLLHERADRDHVEPLVAGEHHLGLVGDREVDPARRDLLDRRRRVGGHLGPHVEPRLLEVAALERRVDPGVVGVDVEVEREVEALGLALALLGLLPAAGGDGDRRDAAPR